MTRRPTVAERVAAGAAWLDQQRPGWHERIDLAVLDVGVADCCPLGQEYGDWAVAPAVRAEPGLGFYAYSHTDFAARATSPGEEWDAASTPVYAEYDDLTEAWRQLVAFRRAVAGARVARRG